MKKHFSHRPCVSMIVLRKNAKGGNEILLVHKPRKRDAWQIPQGGIEQGESVREAAARELMEETSIAVVPSQMRLMPHTYTYDYPAAFSHREKPKYAGQHLTFVSVSVPIETRVKVDHRELDDYTWVKPEEIEKYLKRREYVRVVEDVMREVMS